MGTLPHETPEFQNAVEYTVTITFTVAGGRRRGTAERRAEKVAERLASSAARTPGVVEVAARSGSSFRGEISWPSPVRFDAANNGSEPTGKPDRLTRYRDPEHDRALRSLAAVNAAYRERERADEQRRDAVGCGNTHRTLYQLQPRACGCVYCRPGQHALDAMLDDPPGPSPWRTYRCLCGVVVPAPGERCLPHRGAQLVLLDGDPGNLVRLHGDSGLEL